MNSPSKNKKSANSAKLDKDVIKGKTSSRLPALLDIAMINHYREEIINKDSKEYMGETSPELKEKLDKFKNKYYTEKAQSIINGFDNKYQSSFSKEKELTENEKEKCKLKDTTVKKKKIGFSNEVSWQQAQLYIEVCELLELNKQRYSQTTACEKVVGNNLKMTTPKRLLNAFNKQYIKYGKSTGNLKSEMKKIVKENKPNSKISPRRNLKKMK